MNITAIAITAIICITIAYIVNHSNGGDGNGKKYDMRGKEIIRGNEGKRIYKPSNRLLARRYKNCEDEDCQRMNYVCEKCGWESEMFSGYGR